MVELVEVPGVLEGLELDGVELEILGVEEEDRKLDEDDEDPGVEEVSASEVEESTLTTGDDELEEPGDDTIGADDVVKDVATTRLGIDETEELALTAGVELKGLGLNDDVGEEGAFGALELEMSVLNPPRVEPVSIVETGTDELVTRPPASELVPTPAAALEEVTLTPPAAESVLIEGFPLAELDSGTAEVSLMPTAVELKSELSGTGMLSSGVVDGFRKSLEDKDDAEGLMIDPVSVPMLVFGVCPESTLLAAALETTFDNEGETLTLREPPDEKAADGDVELGAGGTIAFRC